MPITLIEVAALAAYVQCGESQRWCSPQSIWTDYVVEPSKTRGWSELFVFLALANLTHELVYWLYGGFFHLCDTYGWLGRFKIKRKPAQQFPPAKFYRTALGELAVNHAQSVSTSFLLFYVFSLSGMPSVFADLPDWRTTATHITVALFTNDVLFFFAHWTLHTKWLYTRVHAHHHKFRASVGFAAEYAHPLEYLPANVIPLLAAPLLLRTHFAVFLLYLVLRLHETIESHSGYALPWSPWKNVPLVSPASEFHDFHHTHNRGNYGGALTDWMDRLFGTDVAFRTFKAKGGYTH